MHRAPAGFLVPLGGLLGKVNRPAVTEVLPRKRLFDRLDRMRKRPVIWITGPPGCGKTTLVATYLDARKLPCLWSQVDAGDADPATFFYYLGQAAKRAVPGKRKPLPLLTPEYLQGIPAFTQMEVVYWDLLKEGNLKGYMELWHKDVIAWPHWAKKPIGTDVLEKGTIPWYKFVRSYDLKPQAINIFDKFAVIYYRFSWTGPDNRAFSGRIGHFWMKQDGKWQIIGGYSGGGNTQE